MTDIQKKIMRMKYDPEKVKWKSFHYMGYIADNDCVITRLTGHPQEGRTTVEHIPYITMGKRSPDFWTVPLSHSIHLSGDVSLEAMTRKQVADYFGVPSWNEMALMYLIEYLGSRRYKTPSVGVDKTLINGKASDYHSAVYWAQQLIERIHQ